MRNNIVKIISIMIIAVMLSSCGNKDSKVDQAIQNQIQEEDGKTSSSNKPEDSLIASTSETPEEVTSEEKIEEKDSPSQSSDTIDVDLTKLSSTMVYSEVYDMMYTPENYVGKTVKVKGMFAAYTNQDQSQYYPAVIIADATACCSQGLEFVLEGNPVYPKGYPEMNTDITVIGTFETYEEEGTTYCRLQNATLR